MTQFLTDYEYKSGGLDCRLTASGADEAALMVTRGDKGHGHPPAGAWIVYFHRQPEGVWLPEEHENEAVRVFDVTAAGSFVEMSHCPAHVLTALAGSVRHLNDTDPQFALLGAQRARDAGEGGRVMDGLDGVLASIAKAQDELNALRDGMTAYGARHVRDFDLAKMKAPAHPHHLYNAVIDTSFGPLILKVTGAETFSLESPGSARFLNELGVEARVRIEVSGDTIKGLPYRAPVMAREMESVVNLVRDQHRDKFEAAALSHIAEVLTEVTFQEMALERYRQSVVERRRLQDAIAATADRDAAPAAPTL